MLNPNNENEQVNNQAPHTPVDQIIGEIPVPNAPMRPTTLAVNRPIRHIPMYQPHAGGQMLGTLFPAPCTPVDQIIREIPTTPPALNRYRN
jgi:hypothetical protein